MKYGFKEIKRIPVPDIEAVLVEYRHERCGTKLLHIERDDTNKTFMICFKTPPSDDTGVFHIIEHSVLCGSDKYPMKDPFVELIKGSLNTFLNAMTYPDKTVYPVSSMNDKDFLNLIDVYMDAVLNPVFRTNENIFMQEGHRLEYNKDGELCENGIVLNEMKGAYSSPDDLETTMLMRMLYKGTPYEYSAGGDPEAIPSLTYEDFLRAHREHYHPSGAYIILDGSVNTDEVFPLLDSYLSRYEYRENNISIPEVTLKTGVRVCDFYAADEEEQTNNRTRLSIALPAFRFDDNERSTAFSVIRGAIAGGNTAPFCRAMLDTKLCEDVFMTPLDGMQKNCTVITFINVKDGKERELEKLALDELRRIARNGIDKDSLRAALSAMEFSARERNYGSSPVGIIFALSVMDSWLYSDDFSLHLCFEELFKSLNSKIETDYYDKLLDSVIPADGDEVVVTLYPSKTAEAEREEREYARLDALDAKMTEEEKNALRRKCADFECWQKTPDTPEALASLPHLSVLDIDPLPEKIPQTEARVLDTRVLYHPIHTSGITYAYVYFDMRDVTAEECTDAAILSGVLSKLPTENYTAAELRNLIRSNIGTLSFTPVAHTHTSGKTLIYMKLSAGVLDSKREKLPEIIDEILNRTVYDKEEIRRTVAQLLILAKEGINADGTSVALDRTQAAFDTTATCTEHFYGYEAYKILSRYSDAYEKDPNFAEEYANKLALFAKRILTRERATVSLTGKCDNGFAESIITVISKGGETGKFSIATLGTEREGIAIPGRVAFAVLGAPIPREKFSSDMHVVKRILNYEYLWNEIRTAGGAYGAGEVLRENFVAFYSYRDPSPARSIKKYRGAVEFLKEFASKCRDTGLEKYIIGTISSVDTLKTPRLRGEAETTRTLCGIDYERRRKNRNQILTASADSLISFADILEEALGRAVTCTVAARDTLLSMPEDVKTLLDFK